MNMRSSTSWLAVVAVLLAAAGPATAQDKLPDLPEYVFAVAPEDEDLDVVVFGESRPALIRFRVRIHDRGFRTAWDEFVARLHAYLDADGDRVLTTREAERGPWPKLFTNLLPNTPVATPAGDPAMLDSDPKDGRVSPVELSRFLRETLGYDASGAQPGPGQDSKAQSAFTQLDLDGDGALAPAELAATEGLLRRLDADEDEMLALDELRPYDNPFAGEFGEVDGGPIPVVTDGGSIVPLTSASVRKRVAQRLVSRYDSAPRDRRLSRSELGLGEDAFRAADGNGDGAVDDDELERFVAHPTPSLVLVVRFGRPPRRAATIELAGLVDSPGPLASKVKKMPENSLVLDLDGIEVRLGLNDVVRDFRRFFEMRFNEADANKDDSLDRIEANKSRFFGDLFDAVDRNSDDALSHRELTGFVDRSVDATESRLMVTVADSGRNLVEILDSDRDRRLGRRELRGAARRLNGYDRDGDGRVALAELPKSYQLSVGRGPFFGRQGLSFDSYDSPTPDRAGTRGDEVAWFRRMDRNKDGDVSPREFLGSLADFRKLDADGDGLIDAKEAAKGP